MYDVFYNDNTRTNHLIDAFKKEILALDLVHKLSLLDWLNTKMVLMVIGIKKELIVLIMKERFDIDSIND